MAHIQLNFYSASLRKNTNLNIFLPTVSADDYLSGQHREFYKRPIKYRVIYLLHGSYGDCNDWNYMASVERYAQAQGVALVMPSAENSCYVDMYYGEAYQQFIGEELPAFISKMFPVSKEKEDTFIAGLSMGGYGAVRIALKYPDCYSAAASLSGVLDMQDFQNSNIPHITRMAFGYRNAVFKDYKNITGTDGDLFVVAAEEAKETSRLPKLFLTCGTEDFAYEANERFYSYLSEQEIDVVFEKHPGNHGWEYWDYHIKRVIEWMMEQ